MKHLPFCVILAAILLSACSSSYEIQVIDGLPRKVYLTFSKGADVKVGDSRPGLQGFRRRRFIRYGGLVMWSTSAPMEAAASRTTCRSRLDTL